MKTKKNKTGFVIAGFFSFCIFAFVCMNTSCSNLYHDFHEKNSSRTDNTPNSTSSVDMIKVDGGTFTMGDDTDSETDNPEHTVTVSSFYIGKYEITQGLYKKVTGGIPDSCSDTFGSGDNYPVYGVSWYEMADFCNKLSEKENLDDVYTISGTLVTADFTKNGYRLPTEAEWEYAARGGTKSSGYTYSGSNTIEDVAWYIVNASDVGSSDNDYGTHKVGTKAANELGIYDMSGNVWEWCWDWYDKDYYTGSDSSDPTGPSLTIWSSSTPRVMRGGSWINSAGGCCTAFRNYGNPKGYSECIGFRVARNAAGFDSDSTNYTMTWLYNNGSPLTSELPANQKVTISSYDEICYFANYINSGNNGKNITFILTSDIVINSNYSSYSSWSSSVPAVSWTTIGNSSDPFDGVFDGNNKTIYGVYISATTNNIGFFGYAGSDSTIKNSNIDNSYIVGKWGVGTVCGNSYGSIISCSSNSIISTTIGGGGGIVGVLSGKVNDCINSGTIKNTADTDTGWASGGIVGESNGTVTSCTNSGAVSGVMAAGGIIGSANSSSITTNCSNSGTVTGTNWHAGGVVGSLKGSLYNSWNTGSVSCSENAGGVVGSVGDTANTSQQGFAFNCYASGTVSATYAGTFAGFNYATIRNCYSISTILSNNSSYTNAFCGCLCLSKDGTSSVGIISDCYWLSSTASLADSYSQSTTLCSVSSCGSFSSSSSNITAYTSALNYTGTLLNVLNSWVSAQNNEAYYSWIESASGNNGFPMFNN